MSKTVYQKESGEFVVVEGNRVSEYVLEPGMAPPGRLVLTRGIIEDDLGPIAAERAIVNSVSVPSIDDRLAAIEQAISAIASKDPLLAQLPEVLVMEVISPVIETDLA